MADEQVPVLVVGAGPVGICTAVFLARHGIRALLVEQRDRTSRLPRAPGLQARTMELFRAAGLQPDIRALELGDSHAHFEGGILRVRTFREIDDAVVVEAPSLDGPAISPERVMGCGQDRYEQVLVDKAREYGADVRFGTRLVSFDQDGDGVTATIEDTGTGTGTGGGTGGGGTGGGTGTGGGRRRTVRARYLVGADGARSRIRHLLGIERTGRGSVFHALSIYFRAPELAAVLKDRKFILCYATAQGTLMGLSRLHGCDPWLAAPLYHPDRGETPADFTDQRCIELIRTAAGQADLGVEIVAKVPWEGAQLVADRFRSGRVFLAGDAAHVHPPSGGFGANTGIHDAHNLAWKLAAVLEGWGGGALLDTYDAERRRVGQAMAEQAMVRNRIRHGYASAADRAAMVDDIIITLGYRYRSSAIIDDPLGIERHQVLSPQLELTGEPGTRAPHVWLQRAGQQISTIDLFWDSFTLLTGPEGDGWARAATELAARTPVPLRVARIGARTTRTSQDGPGGPGGPDSLGGLAPVDRDWATAYGVKPDGAVLVRPDAFVAWRSTELLPAPGAALAEALHHATGHATCEWQCDL